MGGGHEVHEHSIAVHESTSILMAEFIKFEIVVESANEG